MTLTLAPLTITEPGVYDGIPDEAYHRDPVPGGSLSSTGARQILRTPAHYQHHLTHRVEKAAFDVGHAVHARVLGVGMDIDVLDFESFRTKAAQGARDESYAAGRIPILAADYAPIVAMSEAVLAHKAARAFLEQPGLPEQSAFAVDPDSGVWMRARIDYLPHRSATRTVCVDLKTARSADPRGFAKAAIDFGYDTQSAWYQHTLRLARGDDDTAFVLIVVENTLPHLVSVIELTADFPTIGRLKMRRALDLFAECRANDDWPGYGDDVNYIAPPVWAVRQAEEEL